MGMEAWLRFWVKGLGFRVSGPTSPTFAMQNLGQGGVGRIGEVGGVGGVGGGGGGGGGFGWLCYSNHAQMQLFVHLYNMMQKNV